MSVIEDLVHLLQTSRLSLWLLSNNIQCLSIVFIRFRQRRFSSTVSVAMSGLKPYTKNAHRCRRSRDFLFVLPKGK